MSRKNSFLELADRSRALLMRETAMDELDYHLAILEGGSAYLDQLVRPQPGSSIELVKLYKEHLADLGFWAFYVFLFRHLEVGIAEQWTMDGALEPLQPAEWKRDRFLKEVATLPYKREATNQLEAWLKSLGPKRVLTAKPQSPVEHEYAHH